MWQFVIYVCNRLSFANFLAPTRNCSKDVYQTVLSFSDAPGPCWHDQHRQRSRLDEVGITHRLKRGRSRRCWGSASSPGSLDCTVRAASRWRRRRRRHRHWSCGMRPVPTVIAVGRHPARSDGVRSVGRHQHLDQQQQTMSGTANVTSRPIAGWCHLVNLITCYIATVHVLWTTMNCCSHNVTNRKHRNKQVRQQDVYRQTRGCS